MELKTTKLYSEILEKVNNFGDVICKDENGKDCEAIDDFKYLELAQSIEQLVIDKMVDLIEWYRKLPPAPMGDNRYIGNVETKELIQLYLNK